jgi:hypothetical protein
VKFDLMVYPGRSNSGDVLYQHFYRALPQGGALQILVYSAGAQAWEAAAKASVVLSHLAFDERLRGWTSETSPATPGGARCKRRRSVDLWTWASRPPRARTPGDKR